MTIKATYTFEFDVDTEDLSDEFIDISELSKELTKREIAFLLSNNKITAEDFDYTII